MLDVSVDAEAEFSIIHTNLLYKEAFSEANFLNKNTLFHKRINLQVT